MISAKTKVEIRGTLSLPPQNLYFSGLEAN